MDYQVNNVSIFFSQCELFIARSTNMSVHFTGIKALLSALRSIETTSGIEGIQFSPQTPVET